MLGLMAFAFACEKDAPLGFIPSGVYKYQDSGYTFNDAWTELDPSNTVLIFVHGAQNHEEVQDTIDYFTQDYIDALRGVGNENGDAIIENYVITFYNGHESYPDPNTASSASLNEGVLKSWVDNNLGNVEDLLTNNPGKDVVMLGSSGGSLLTRYLLAFLDSSITNRVKILVTVGGLHEGCGMCEKLAEDPQATALDALEKAGDFGGLDTSHPDYHDYSAANLALLNNGILDPDNFPHIQFFAIAGRSAASGYPVPKNIYDAGYVAMDKLVEFGVEDEGTTLDIFPRLIPGDPLDTGDGNGEMDNDGFMSVQSSMGLSLAKRCENWHPFWVEDNHRDIRRRTEVAQDIFGGIITRSKTLPIGE